MVGASVPGGEGPAVPVLLSPAGGRRFEPGAEFRSPVLVEGLQADDRRGANITHGDIDAPFSGRPHVGGLVLTELLEFSRGGEAVVAGAAEPGVDEIGARGGRRFGLVTDGAQVLKRVDGNSDAQPRRRPEFFAGGEYDDHQ